ncbi:MAG: c-type cytochrome [Gammaproteobacteria bacterium]|nr:c-type cytochrome [Gammaproteobacteria bacterium]
MKSGVLISIVILGSLLVGNATFAATDAVRKRYSEYCSVCHGDRGDGRSHAQQGLVPPPRDFTDQAFAATVTRDRIIAAITNGVPGTAMIAWATEFDDAAIGELADYVLDEFVKGAQKIPGDVRNPDEFAQIYRESCSVCHGDDGTGARWGQESLSTKPRDFTSVASQAELTRDRMIVSVANGRPGTPMPGFASQLNPQQVEGIVDFIRARFMRPVVAADTAVASDAHIGGNYQDQPFPHDLGGHFERGRALYFVNCVECHGTSGDGNGPRAYFIFPKPRNFRDPATQRTLNRPRLYSGIADGVIGREMPAWSKVFSEQDIADVAEFVYREFITANPAE